MKKLLLSLFVVLSALMTNAESVVFNFDSNATDLFGIAGRSSGSATDGDILEAVTATLDGVSVTVSPRASGSNENRLWYASPVLRMYSGDLKVSAPGHDITKIKFEASSSKFNMECSVGAFSESANEKVWEITDNDKTSVVKFTVKGNTQLNSMTVILDGEETSEPVVEITGKGDGTVDSPYDTERALSIIKNGAQTADMVYVAGTITEITEYSLQYGNATYYISNGEAQIMVYRGKGLDNKAFIEDDEIKVGDALVICGVLKNYNGTPEITNSYIHSIDGQTTPEQPEFVPVGDGTKANPYTVDDIIGMDILDSNGQQYWVKGYILGSATSATKLNDPQKAVDTNLALGMTADATKFIPVQLPAGEMRSILGVATNPDNVGKEVVVLGTLEKYFQVAAVKNVSECIIDGRDTSAIIDITSDNATVRYYNIQGVEVANPQAGQFYIRVQGDKITKVIK